MLCSRDAFRSASASRRRTSTFTPLAAKRKTRRAEENHEHDDRRDLDVSNSGRRSNRLLEDRVKLHPRHASGGPDAIDDKLSVDFAGHAIGPVRLLDQRVADDAAPERIESLHLRNFGVQRLSAVGFEIGKVRRDVAARGEIRFEHPPVVRRGISANRASLDR